MKATVKGRRRAGNRMRFAIQAAMMLLVVAGASLRNLAPNGTFLPFRLPELQGLCPFGGAQAVGRLVFDTASVLRPDRAYLWVLAGGIGASLLIGAVFCGWLCPLGTVQEWVGRLGRRIFGGRYNRLVPVRVDRALGLLRYGVLGVLLVGAAGAVGLAADAVNPSYAFLHLWTAAVPLPGLVVLAALLAASLLVERPWCRWLCPLGALHGLASRLAPWTIRRSERPCTGCRRCDRVCPMGVAVSACEVVRDPRCHRCAACVASCPISGALSHSGPTSRFRLAPSATGALAVSLFFLPVGVARTAGWYSPAAGGHVAAAGSAALELEAIRPGMSVAEAAETLGMEAGELLGLLELDADFDLSTALYDIEEHPDHEHVTFRHIRAVLERHARDL